jgi:uncharacterized protein Yka (UPF0111/DUF47 family)
VRLRQRLRQTVRDLTGRTDHELVALIQRQLDIAGQGAQLALATVRGDEKTAEARRRMTGIEHAGDALRAELVDLLRRVLATPMDREDLYRLSRSVDDVLDNVRDLVRELDLLAVAADSLLEAPLEAVVDGITALRDAVGMLLSNPAEVAVGALAARKANIRQQYQLSLAQLLTGEPTSEMLRRRELLRRVDVVGLRLSEAANALSDGAMKRCH